MGTVRRLFRLGPKDPVYGGIRPLKAAHIAELIRFARRPASAAQLGDYDCYLGYYLESSSARSDPRFRGDYPPPRVLRGFPGAKRVKPRTSV